MSLGERKVGSLQLIDCWKQMHHITLKCWSHLLHDTTLHPRGFESLGLDYVLHKLNNYNIKMK